MRLAARPEKSRTVARAAPTLSELVEIPRADHNDRALLDGARLVTAVVALPDRVDPTA